MTCDVEVENKIDIKLMTKIFDIFDYYNIKGTFFLQVSKKNFHLFKECDWFSRFKQHEYGDVILPFVVLRRLDCVLEPHKDNVITTYKQFKKKLSEDKLFPVLQKAAKGLKFFNTSLYDLQRLSQDAKNIELNFGF